MTRRSIRSRGTSRSTKRYPSSKHKVIRQLDRMSVGTIMLLMFIAVAVWGIISWWLVYVH
jgi:hypothetical protein